MSPKGFSVPLSPEGRASLTTHPPWHYAGDLLVIDFDAEPAAVSAVLPPGLDALRRSASHARTSVLTIHTTATSPELGAAFLGAHSTGRKHRSKCPSGSAE